MIFSHNTLHIEKAVSIKIEGRSLFIFGPNNPIRKACHRIMHHPAFDWIILFFIGVSTVTLAIESPLHNPEGNLVRVLVLIDYVMTAIFVVEMMIKIMALGFAFNGKKSYMRDGWCVLDFIIVMVSIFSIAF